MVPNLISYNAVVSACKNSQEEQALKVSEAMKLQGVVPDIVICSAWLSARDKGQQVERALKAF